MCKNHISLSKFHAQFYLVVSLFSCAIQIISFHQHILGHVLNINQKLSERNLIMHSSIGSSYLLSRVMQSRVQTKFPEPTDSGLQFLKSELEHSFLVYPEADMLLSMESGKSYSSFSEWGKGWAHPEIRRQRLQSKKAWRKPRKRKSHKHQPDLSTVRGRLSAKLTK